jgi:hypothetical protein
MKYSKELIAEQKAYLLSTLPPGATVYTQLNHVSRSGMMRSITPLVIVNGAPRRIVRSVCILLDQSIDAYDGVRMGGCGMDMGFALVYNLSRILYPEGFGIKCEGCGFRADTPDNAKKASSEPKRTRGHSHSFLGRNGDSSGWDNDGGYALRQQWL